MILEGYVNDKNQTPIENAIIEVKDEHFATLYETHSDKAGYYKLDIPAGRYPLLTAVKDYGASYLEYWCQSLPLQSDMSLDVIIDKLELYGLHAFSVKGAGNGLMIYFRPMSLPKFQQGAQDIAPVDFTVRVIIDGREATVIHSNLVKEFVADREMTAYLIQSGASTIWYKLNLQIQDKDGNYGMATIFNNDI